VDVVERSGEAMSLRVALGWLQAGWLAGSSRSSVKSSKQQHSTELSTSRERLGRWGWKTARPRRRANDHGPIHQTASRLAAFPRPASKQQFHREERVPFFSRALSLSPPTI